MRSRWIPLLCFSVFMAFATQAGAGQLQNLVVSPVDSGAGQQSIYTITFEIPVGDSLPADGIVRVTFPTAFDVSTVIVAMGTDSLDGGLTVSTHGDTVYVYRDSTGTQLVAGEIATLKIANVTNATVIGSYQVVVEALRADSVQISSGTAGITIVPGPLHHFTISALQDTVTAGIGLTGTVTVIAYDAYNNEKTNYSGTLQWSTSDPNPISLPATTVVNNSSTALFNGADFVLKTAGAQTFTVTDQTTGVSATSEAVNVMPAGISSFVLTGPASATAGTPFVVTVQNARDQFGNAASGTVQILPLDASHNAPDGTSPALNDVAVVDGSGSAKQTLYKAETGVQIIGQVGSVSDTIVIATVNPGAAQIFALSGYPTTVTAGDSLAVTLTVQDAWGNTKTNYTGTVQYGSSDANATLPADYVFQLSDNGVHTDTVILKTAGIQRIWVNETDGSPADTTSGIIVEAGPISNFTLTAPDTVSAGEAFALNVTGAVDQYGNPAAGQVTVSVSPGDAASPDGTQPQLADITVSDGTGSAQQILVKAGLDTLVGQAVGTGVQKGKPVYVEPGKLARFDLAGVPSAVTAGEVFPNPVVVTAYDAYGNRKTNYTGSVYFESTDANASLTYNSSNRYTFTSAESGQHSFNGSDFVLKTSGAQTVTVTDGNISQESSAIDVSHASLFDFTLAAGTTQTAGVGFALTVSNAVDQFGNAWSGLVTVSAVSGGGASPNGTQPSFNDVAVNNGSGTATQILVNAVATVLQGTAEGVTRQTESITVNPGAFDSLAVTGFPSTAIAGQAWSTPTNDIIVTAYDRYGNVKTDFDGSVYFLCNTDPNAQLPYNSPTNAYSFVPATDEGSHTFPGDQFVLNTPGTHHVGVHEVSTGYEVLSGGIDVTGLELLSVTAGVTQVTRGQKGIEVSLTVRKRGSQAVDNLSASLSFTQSGNDVTSDYTVTRTDNITGIPAGAEGTYVLTFSVDVGDAATLGNVTITGSVSGTVSGVTVSDDTPSSTHTWTVYKPASLTVTSVAVAKDTVSQGDTGIAVDVAVTNGDAQTSTAVIDDLDLFFTGASGDQTSDFMRTLDSANPSSLAGGLTDTFRVTFDVSQVARTGAVVVYGQIRGHDANSGAVTSSTSAQGDTIYVKENPALRVVSITTSQAKVSQGQTSPWTVRVVLTNGTSSPLAINFDDASTYIRFRKAGQDLTSEYSISTPTALESGSTSLDPGATDALVYVVDATGTTTGEITIYARVAASGGIYTDSEVSGVFGAVTVQTPPSLVVQSITPSQPTVTAGQTAPWEVRVLVANQGEADFRLNLDSTWIAFSTGNDFGWSKPAAWAASGDLLLRGGTTDTLVFAVAQTGATAGTATISARVKGVDVNSLDYVSAASNAGTVLVQSPAEVVITRIAASDTFLTRSTSTNWTVRVTLENRGESAVTVDLAAQMYTYVKFYSVFNGSEQTDYQVVWPTGFEGSGTIKLAGGASDDLVFVVTKTGATLGQVQITAAVRTVEDNSGRVIDTASSDSVSDYVVVQSPSAIIYLPGSVSPTDVNRGSNARFTIRVHNGGGSTVRLDPQQTVFRFTDGPHTFQAQLDSNQATSIQPGDTTLTFTSQPVPANMTVGAYQPEVVLVGDENGNAYSKTLSLSDSVHVNEAAALAIEYTRPSQSTVTAGQTQPWQIVMVVTNNGGSPVSLDSTSLQLYRLSTNVTDKISYNAPTVFDGSGTAQLAGGRTDSLIFQVTSVDSTMPTGSIRIQGAVYVTDVNDPTRHLQQSTNGNSGYVIVQSPAVLSIVRVRPWQPSVTKGQTEDWYVTVKLQNSGESAVTIDSSQGNTFLSFGIGTGWQVKPPSRLSDGTWVLPGGQTDSLVFTVDVSDASVTGLCTIDAQVHAVENNSGRTIVVSSDQASRGSVVVETAAQVQVDTVIVDQATAPNAPNLDTNQPYTLKVRVVNLGEDEADSVVVRLRSQEGFSSLPNSVYVGSVAGNSAVWGEVQGRTGAVADTTESITVAIAKAVARNTGSAAEVVPSPQTGDTTCVLNVQKPAYLAIDSVWTDRDTVVAKQTSPYWHVYVSVRDTGTAPVRVADPSPSDLQFRIRGVPQTGYVIAPVSLSEEQRTLDPSAGKDSVVLTYEIRQTGATGGLAGIFASVGGVDLNYPTREPAPSASGSGQVFVASLASVQIVRTEPIAPRLDGEGRALVNTGQSFSIEVDVANKGGEDLLDVTVRVVASGGSVVEQAKTIDTLRVGQTQTLTFSVSAAAEENLDGETFRAQIVGATGRESGLAAEVQPPVDDVAVAIVQSPARLRIRWVRNAAPNAPFVDTGQTFPVNVMVENLGTEPAQSVRLNLVGSPDSLLQQPIYTITLSSALAGHDSTTATFDVVAGAVRDTVGLAASVASAVGANSGGPVSVEPALSDSSFAIVQTPAAPAVLAVVARPDTVIAESRQEWRIYVAVTDTGEADVTFTPANSDVKLFVGGVDETQNYAVVAPSRLKGRSGLTLGSGEVDTLVYRVTETGPRGGVGTIQIQVRGYDRNRGAQLGQVAAFGTGSFFVETNAVVRIRRTQVLAPHISAQGWGIVNTGQSFQVSVTVEERQGREGVDSVKVRLRSLNGASVVVDSVRTIPYLEPAGTGSVTFDVVAAPQENLSGEVLQAEIVEATAHESQIPAAIEPPADPVNARATVRVERPASLAVRASVSGGDSLLTVGETFWLEVLVENLGTAQVDTGGRVVVMPPAGYMVAGPDSQFTDQPVSVPFRADEVARVRMRAPDTTSSADTIVTALLEVPRDRNTLQPCQVLQDTTRTVVSTLKPFIHVARSEISLPEGARDGVLSTGQDFFVRADVVSSSDLNQRRVALRAPEGRGYLVVGDSSRAVNADSATVYWYVKAPGSADLTPQRLIVFAEGIDGTGVRRTDLDTLVVRTVPRATLSLEVNIVSPPGATDGVLTQGQPFLLQAKVVNAGQAAAIGHGKLRLDPGNTGVVLDPSEEGLVKIFEMSGPVQTVTWRLRAPAEPHDPDVLTVYFEERPDDENTGGPADVTKLSQDLTVSTVAGGFVRLDTIFIASPEGARDRELSTGQSFVVTAILTAEGVSDQVDATILFSSPEYFTQSSLTKVTPGQRVSASWQVVAPSKASPVPDTIWVSVSAHDANNDTVTLTDVSAPMLVYVHEQARLSLKPSIESPPGATDGVLSTGQTFVVKATIENSGTAGLVPGDVYRVRIKVPAAGGYRLADGEPDTKSSETPELSWTLVAPDEPTLATYNVELILEDRPRDENSYEKATVARERDVVPVTTLQRAKLKLAAAITDPPGARGGTVWTGQVFTVTTSIENLGDAGWLVTDSLRMVLSVPQGFEILGDSVQATWNGHAQWRVKAPQQSGLQSSLRIRMLNTPLDENSYTPAEVIQDKVDLPVTVQAKMLIVSSEAVNKTNTVARGQSGIPLLKLHLENRGQKGADNILLRGLNVYFTDRKGGQLQPEAVAARVWIASAENPEVALGATTSIGKENPVYIPLSEGAGDTLAGGEVRNYLLYVDLLPSTKVADFQVTISRAEDLDAVDAESGTRVLIGDRNGNVVQELNAASDFSVVVTADLKNSFGCYPNPFGYGTRRTTTIVYYLKKSTSVDISIYTLAGELVWNRHFSPTDPQGQEGMHDGDVVWDGRNGSGMAVLNGVYVVRIVTGTGESAITKVAVVR